VVFASVMWLVIAQAAGWIADDLAEPWVMPGLWIGAVLLGAGLILRILSPVGRRMRAVRCVRCGAPIEQGQTYCADHLRETLDEYRDRQREQFTRRPGA